MQNIVKFFVAILLVVFTAGCSNKNSKDLYNLTPDQWYTHIISDIASGSLKSADNHFTSFASEHVNSPLLEQIILILAQAHIDEGEYVLANFYLDQYIRKFGTPAKIEYAQYLKIKANFDSFTKPNRNQQLIDSSINEIDTFLLNYPNTIYRPLLLTMKTKFELAKHYLNSEIYKLYKRTDRNISAEVYKQRLDSSSLKDSKMIAPKLPWYMRPFE